MTSRYVAQHSQSFSGRFLGGLCGALCGALCAPLLGLSLLALAGCEPTDRPARGPQSEPIERVAMGRMDLASSQYQALPEADFRAALEALVEQPPSGMEIALLKAQAADAAADMVVLTLALDRFEPRLIEPQPQSNELNGGSLLLESDSPWSLGSSVLLGSFFVAGFAPLEPLGLLQTRGREVSPLQPHGYTRILGVDQSGLGVVHRGAFHRGQFASAVQVGPGIIEAGQLDINPTERSLPTYLRSFVGACGDRALVGVSFSRLHLYDLGRRLQAWIASQNLVCDEVVNLSGDRETLLVLPEFDANSLLVYGDLQAPKTALLGFRSRLDSPVNVQP